MEHYIFKNVNLHELRKKTCLTTDWCILNGPCCVLCWFSIVHTNTPPPLHAMKTGVLTRCKFNGGHLWLLHLILLELQVLLHWHQVFWSWEVGESAHVLSNKIDDITPLALIGLSIDHCFNLQYTSFRFVGISVLLLQSLSINTCFNRIPLSSTDIRPFIVQADMETLNCHTSLLVLKHPVNHTAL